MRRFAAVCLVGGVAAFLSGCTTIDKPGKTDRIEFVSSSTVDGYKYDYYRNLAYPCSISGYQTFVIGTKVGSDDAATRPLWVRMRGGGVGWFDENGKPQPTAGQKTEEDPAGLISYLSNTGVPGRVKSDAAGFRLVSVSMCDHDIYAGGDEPDPNNPNTLPDGSPRTTNGLFATKAAVQYARAKYPTGKVFLHGTSAGSAGTFGVAWGLQQQGVPPAGLVADSGVVNQEWEVATNQQDVCTEKRDDAALAGHQEADPGPAGRPQQRARQAGEAQRAHRPGPARVEPQRQEHLRGRADELPAPRRHHPDAWGRRSARTSRCARRSSPRGPPPSRGTCACA